jgi:hypothetical protein
LSQSAAQVSFTYKRSFERRPPAADFRWGGTLEAAPNSAEMSVSVREIPELELALLRRGLDERAAVFERCGRCHRTPLIGERVYVYEQGPMLCELCRAGNGGAPVRSRVVRGPEFGHSIRVADKRAA